MVHRVTASCNRQGLQLLKQRKKNEDSSLHCQSLRWSHWETLSTQSLHYWCSPLCRSQRSWGSRQTWLQSHRRTGCTTPETGQTNKKASKTLDILWNQTSETFYINDKNISAKCWLSHEFTGEDVWHSHWKVRGKSEKVIPLLHWN